MLQALHKTDASVQSEDDIQLALNRKANQKERITLLLPFAGVVLLVVIFEILTRGQFLGMENLRLLVNQCFTMGVVVVGGAFLYAVGGLDMSIGSVMALSAMVMTLLFNAEVPLLLSFLAGTAVSISCMSVTAFVRNYLKVTPFIASMCVMNICQGVVLSVVADKGRIVFPYSRAAWVDATPTKIITLAVLIGVGYFLFNYTGFGKSLKAIGGNTTAARISGIRVERCIFLAYATIGFTLAVGGLFTVVRAGIADTAVGGGLNLNVMTAIVLGGFPLSGGANAKFHAPLVGALTVTVLTNGLGLLGYANAVGYAIKGLLFIIVVALTYEKSKGKLIS